MKNISYILENVFHEYTEKVHVEILLERKIITKFERLGNTDECGTQIINQSA